MTIQVAIYETAAPNGAIASICQERNGHTALNVSPQPFIQAGTWVWVVSTPSHKTYFRQREHAERWSKCLLDIYM